MADHTALAKQHWKKRCLIFSLWWQKIYLVLPCQFLFTRLSLVRTSPRRRYQPKILIFRGIFISKFSCYYRSHIQEDKSFIHGVDWLLMMARWWMVPKNLLARNWWSKWPASWETPRGRYDEYRSKLFPSVRNQGLSNPVGKSQTPKGDAC
jgi:hypothetical protein